MNSAWILILALAVTVTSAAAASDSATRIIGGVPAAPGEIPYIVSLQAYNYVGGRYLTCGGSLITARHVVTAAHCVAGQNTRNLDVVAGSHSISDTHMQPEPTEQRREIAAVDVHPEFSAWTLDADIAVITLRRSYDLNEYVQPIALAPAGHDPAPGASCMTAGFGNVLNNGSQHFPGVLHRVELGIVGRESCQELYAASGAVTEGMVCASVPEGGKGACHGDSGGPLVCQDGGDKETGTQARYLAGTVSWGMRICALPNEPSVFANVGRYRRFVDEIISD